MRTLRARWSARVFFYSFLLIGLVGLFSPLSYNALPANAMFECVLLVCAALIVKIPKRSVIAFFIGSVLYVGISYVLMLLFQPAHILDFAQAYKAFFYIAPLCLFFGANVFSRSSAVKLLKWLLVMFLAKYAYSIALDLTPRMGTRPGLYVENNFELIFLMLMFYILRNDLGRRMVLWFAVLVAIIGLSGSRSSVLALLVLFYGVFLNRLTLRTFFYMAGLLALGGVAVAIFVLRSDGGGIESIDRYNFMMVFLGEVAQWPAWKFLLGSMPLTPLSSYSCQSLSYYEDLFSFSGDGHCYSVILHSYFLRAVFDHGILGLLFLLTFMVMALKKSGYSRIEVVVVLGIVCSSALSVSAMNSVFVSLALALAMGLRRPMETQPHDTQPPRSQ